MTIKNLPATATNYRYIIAREVDGDQGGAARAAAPKPAAAAPRANMQPGQSTVATYRKADDPNPYANVGRNEPCPCGSGKKFKNCHGRR